MGVAVEIVSHSSKEFCEYPYSILHISPLWTANAHWLSVSFPSDVRPFLPFSMLCVWFATCNYEVWWRTQYNSWGTVAIITNLHHVQFASSDWFVHYFIHFNPHHSSKQSCLAHAHCKSNVQFPWMAMKSTTDRQSRLNHGRRSFSSQVPPELINIMTSFILLFSSRTHSCCRLWSFCWANLNIRPRPHSFTHVTHVRHPLYTIRTVPWDTNPLTSHLTPQDALLSDSVVPVRCSCRPMDSDDRTWRERAREDCIL